MLDIAIPVDNDGKLLSIDKEGKSLKIFHKKLNEILTPVQLQTLANMQLIEVIKTMIRRLREFGQKINEGTDKEEDSVRARMHLCKHDIGESCGGEEEI